MHIRQQVRNYISAKIREVPELANSTFESRIYELTRKDLPAALVFSETEMNEPATKQNKPGIQKRLIETAVYVFATADNEIENSLDNLSEKVENKIFEDQTLGGLAVQTVLDNTNLLIGGDPEAPVGASRMSFITTVLTQQGSSGLPIQQNGGIFQ